MRVLVCGSRHFTDEVAVARHLTMAAYGDDPIEPGSWLSIPRDLVIVEGGTKGADTLAKEWAIKHNIPFEEYPADWNKHGKAAGPIRNKQMLDEGKPDLVIAFLVPNSKGTKNMIEQAEKAGVPVKIINI